MSRQTRQNQALGREAIHAELDIPSLSQLAPFRVLATRATTKRDHLDRPELGSQLSEHDQAKLVAEHSQVQLVVSDGLSAEAVHANLPDLLAVLSDGLTARQVHAGQPMLVRYGRVKLAEPISQAVQCDLIVYLLGERPGGDAQAARSLSAYLVYRTSDNKSSAGNGAAPLAPFEYTVISNIHSAGLPALEAAGVIGEKIAQILEFKAAGNRLEALLNAQRSSPKR